jgi:hypothetical protein
VPEGLDSGLRDQQTRAPYEDRATPKAIGGGTRGFGPAFSAADKASGTFGIPRRSTFVSGIFTQAFSTSFLPWRVPGPEWPFSCALPLPILADDRARRGTTRQESSEPSRRSTTATDRLRSDEGGDPKFSSTGISGRQCGGARNEIWHSNGDCQHSVSGESRIDGADNSERQCGRTIRSVKSSGIFSLLRGRICGDQIPVCPAASHSVTQVGMENAGRRLRALPALTGEGVEAGRLAI